MKSKIYYHMPSFHTERREVVATILVTPGCETLHKARSTVVLAYQDIGPETPSRPQVGPQAHKDKRGGSLRTWSEA